MVVGEGGDATRGHPQAQLLATSCILSWGASGIPTLSLLLILIPSSIVISHKTQQNLREIRQYKKANHYYKYCCKSIHILFLHYIYCIPTFVWQKLFKENHRVIKTSTQRKENRICQKQNSLQQSRNFEYFYISKNSDKLGQYRQFVY